MSPRQRISDARTPGNIAGRVTIISIAVSGRRISSARNSTPDTLIFAVRPSCQSSVPTSRYRHRSSAANRRARGDCRFDLKGAATTFLKVRCPTRRSPVILVAPNIPRGDRVSAFLVRSWRPASSPNQSKMQNPHSKGRQIPVLGGHRASDNTSANHLGSRSRTESWEHET